MRIGILSDIHGNANALNEVLKNAKAEKVDQLLILGDIVGYYYQAKQVLELLDHWKYTFIRGNHEDILKQIIKKTIDPDSVKKKYGSAHFMAIDDLTPASLNFLTNAPVKMELTLGDTHILICHGSPWDHNEYLYPDTAAEILNKSDILGIDFVFVGHSHYPFIHHTKNTKLVNVGSVGQSRLKGGVAQWVILDTDSNEIKFMNNLYFVESLISDVNVYDPTNAYLKDILIRK